MVGFVSVKQAPRVQKADARHSELTKRATEWLHLLNSRNLRALDELVAEDATYHVSGRVLLGVLGKSS